MNTLGFLPEFLPANEKIARLSCLEPNNLWAVVGVQRRFDQAPVRTSPVEARSAAVRALFIAREADINHPARSARMTPLLSTHDVL